VRIRIDRRHCIASGHCVLNAPELFAQDEDGLVVLRDANPPPALHAAAKAAEAACPAAVITVDEDEAEAS
jgi:ferredoxin